ncbi:MAG: hypothetical protein CO093_07435 [Alphaproteobacteria bacterium CG_4_9_14_3_um_filter_47_13]|nr:MAG: hypothetical protein CO093_07435 [Alphaproteobacteria bacterium CG_4_9_14_3_um_filter_47_13]
MILYSLLTVELSPVLWMTISGVTIFLLGLILYLTVKAYRQKAVTGIEGMINEKAFVTEWKEKKGRVRLQGEIWHAYSDEYLDLKKNDKVFISAVEDLAVKIRATK